MRASTVLAWVLGFFLLAGVAGALFLGRSRVAGIAHHERESARARANATLAAQAGFDRDVVRADQFGDGSWEVDVEIMRPAHVRWDSIEITRASVAYTGAASDLEHAPGPAVTWSVDVPVEGPLPERFVVSFETAAPPPGGAWSHLRFECAVRCVDPASASSFSFTGSESVRLDGFDTLPARGVLDVVVPTEPDESSEH